MEGLISVKERDYVAFDSVENQLLEAEGDRLSIVEIVPQIVEANSTSIELILINEAINVVEVTDAIVLISDVANGVSGVNIWDEGTLLASGVKDINFIGADVVVKDPHTGRINIFIPAPKYVSHFNSNDGINDCFILDAPVANRVVSAPTLPNIPFSVGDWAANQIHQVVNTSLLTYQTPVPFSICDLSTVLSVLIFGADGITPINTFITPTLTGNAVFISPDNAVTINISSWSDNGDKYQAMATFIINVGVVLQGSGRFGVSIEHINSLDGSFVKVQNQLFYDSNPLAPDICSISIAEGYINSYKYLSGLRYYSIDDQFVITVLGLNNLNADSYPQPFVIGNCAQYSISDFALGSADLTDWTPKWDHVGASYVGAQVITQYNNRIAGNVNVSAAVLDWGVAKSVQSPNSKVLINTFFSTSTAQMENFDEESYRQYSDFGGGVPYGTWDSGLPLQPGEAIVFGGFLGTPNAVYTIDANAPEIITDFPSFMPKLNDGSNQPDYSTYGCPVNYYRTFTAPTPGSDNISIGIYLEGIFVSGNAMEDMLAGRFEIYIRRMNVNPDVGGNFGIDCPPLTVHGTFNDMSSFDDGVTNGSIRESDRIGNYFACTMGGYPLVDGMFFHIRLLDPAVRISKISIHMN